MYTCILLLCKLDRSFKTVLNWIFWHLASSLPCFTPLTDNRGFEFRKSVKCHCWQSVLSRFSFALVCNHGLSKEIYEMLMCNCLLYDLNFESTLVWQADAQLSSLPQVVSPPAHWVTRKVIKWIFENRNCDLF